MNEPLAVPASPLDAFPVGAIYLSTADAHPASLFGGGVWERVGAGTGLVPEVSVVVQVWHRIG